MSGLFDQFSTNAESLVEGLISLVLSAHKAIGLGFLLLLFLQVLLMLASIYLRPVRTRKQFIKLMLILFAVGGICSMTIWLLLKAAGSE